MTVNKSLREQVAEAIANNLNGLTGPDCFRTAADAAIQAVREAMRCGRCRMYDQHYGLCDLTEQSVREDCGCIRWREKDGCIHWEAKGE